MPRSRAIDADPAARPIPTDGQGALLDALAQLLAPLARLAVARGLPYAALDEALKRALVQAASAEHAALLPHRRVSRISTATGIHRREVTRLMRQAQDAPSPPAPAGRSLASEVFAHWTSAADYQDAGGRPRVLPRRGPAPSFETLAQAVTRDVHPRSLLDELLRLKLASLDDSGERVRLAREGFVPSGDNRRLLDLLGANVGDHLAAAVANVLAEGRGQLEQAVFADGLTDAAVAELRERVTPLWSDLLRTLVPPMERMVEQGAAAPPGVPRRRVRIGLYTYDELLPGPVAAATAPVPATTRAAPRRKPRTR
ncbi:MAG: DUF6502 family protein [Aquabacterium sp.]